MDKKLTVSLMVFFWAKHYEHNQNQTLSTAKHQVDILNSTLLPFETVKRKVLDIQHFALTVKESKFCKKVI